MAAAVSTVSKRSSAVNGVFNGIRVSPSKSANRRAARGFASKSSNLNIKSSMVFFSEKAKLSKLDRKPRPLLRGIHASFDLSRASRNFSRAH